MIGDLDRKRHLSLKAKDYASSETEQKMTSDEWCSPPEVSIPLRQFYGGPAGIDPCSNPRSIIDAHMRLYEAGLIAPWCRPKLIGKGIETGYSNWPYSQNEAWSDKAIRELGMRNLGELVILCMTSTSTVWWKNLMLKPRRNPRVLLTKRIKCLGPDGKPVDSSRFDPALIYYGTRHAAFDREFASLTMWSTWGRSSRR